LKLIDFEGQFRMDLLISARILLSVQQKSIESLSFEGSSSMGRKSMFQRVLSATQVAGEPSSKMD